MATNLPLRGMPGPQDQMDAVSPGQEATPAPEVFDLTAGKYDLVVQAGPSFTTRREETAAALTEAMRGNPQFASVLGPLLLKTLDVPGIEEITKKIEALAAQSAPQDPAKVKMAEMAAQLEADKQKAQNDLILAQQKLKNDAILARDKAKADHELARDKAMWEAELEAWKAGQQATLADKTADQQAEREIRTSNEKAAKVANPDRDIAMIVAQAVKDGLSQVKVNLQMGKRRRTPVFENNDRVNGRIIDMIDEPIDEAPPTGATLQ